MAVDVTPLQNAHRYRGIGTYVRGLAQRLAAQSDVPIEFWGWTGQERFEAPPPHRVVDLSRYPMPEYRGAWLFAQLAMKSPALPSKIRPVHAADPHPLPSLGGRELPA